MTSALISIHATILLCLAVFLSTARGFYLPGVAPHDFYTGEPVELKVNKLRYAHVTHSSSSRIHPLFTCNIYIYHTYSSDPPKIPYWSIHLLSRERPGGVARVARANLEGGRRGRAARAGSTGGRRALAGA